MYLQLTGLIIQLWWKWTTCWGEDGLLDGGHHPPAGSAGSAGRAADLRAIVSTPQLETSNSRAPRTPGAPEHHARRHFTTEQHKLPLGLASHWSCRRPGHQNHQRWPHLAPWPPPHLCFQEQRRQGWHLLRVRRLAHGCRPQVSVQPVGIHRAWLLLHLLPCWPLHHPLGHSHGYGGRPGHGFLRRRLPVHHQHGPHPQEAWEVCPADLRALWVAGARDAHIQRQKGGRSAVLLCRGGFVHGAG